MGKTYIRLYVFEQNKVYCAKLALWVVYIRRQSLAQQKILWLRRAIYSQYRFVTPGWLKLFVYGVE